jgi:hypothetical protein
MAETLDKPENYEDIVQYNVWIVDVPKPVIRMEKLPEDSKVLIAIIRGKVKAFLITDTTTKEAEIKRLIEEDRELFEELKRIGD